MKKAIVIGMVAILLFGALGAQAVDLLLEQRVVKLEQSDAVQSTQIANLNHYFKVYGTQEALSTPTAIPVPNTPVPELQIGVVITTIPLKVRECGRLNCVVLARLQPGTTVQAEFCEYPDAGGYTWCRLDDGRWVAAGRFNEPYIRWQE